LRFERLSRAPLQDDAPSRAQISLDHLADQVMREPAGISLRLDQEARPAGGRQPGQHFVLRPRDHGDKQRARRSVAYHRQRTEDLSCYLRQGFNALPQPLHDVPGYHVLYCAFPAVHAQRPHTAHHEGRDAAGSPQQALAQRQANSLHALQQPFE
jgi:hypothetical protein